MSKLNDVPKKENRGRKPKKQPTPEEFKKMLDDSKTELSNILKDLKEELEKVKPMNLKRIPELVNETILNLTEDLEDIQEKISELVL